jgi:exopolysaccharide biosynthesis predicted pyruvyltransferase EpsI
VPRAIVISALLDNIDRALLPLLPPGSRCALLDFPNYANVGDNAIWLGELAYLRRFGIEVVYRSDQVSYSRKQLAARIGDGTILLSGGGNFGDLWPAHQWFREEVVSSFPDRKIVQLPQTIRFTQRSNLERARRVFARHPNVTILVRDDRSRAVDLGAEVALCPDMAFALGPLERPCAPTTGILWLLRGDHESAIVPAIENTDWRDDETAGGPKPPLTLTAARRLHEILSPRVARRSVGNRWLATVGDRLAGARLARGLRTLSQGSVVVTDRLHGHVLSLMLGIPHVLLDTRHGKLRGFYETWTQGSELTYWADSIEKALQLARRVQA